MNTLYNTTTLIEIWHLYATPKTFFSRCLGYAYKMKTARNGYASEVKRKNHKVEIFCNKCYNLSNKKPIGSKTTKNKHLKTKKGRTDHLQYQFTPTQSISNGEGTNQEGSD